MNISGREFLQQGYVTLLNYGGCLWNAFFPIAFKRHLILVNKSLYHSVYGYDLCPL